MKNWFQRFVVIVLFAFVVVLLTRWFLSNYFRFFQIIMSWTAILIGTSLVIAYRKAYSLSQLTRKLLGLVSKYVFGEEQKDYEFAFEEKEHVYNKEIYLFAGILLVVLGASTLFGGP